MFFKIILLVANTFFGENLPRRWWLPKKEVFSHPLTYLVSPCPELISKKKKKKNPGILFYFWAPLDFFILSFVLPNAPRGPDNHRWKVHRSAQHGSQVFLRRAPAYMRHYLHWQSAPRFQQNRTYMLAFVGYAIFTLYMTVYYHDRGRYMSELADGKANLICCDVSDQRRAAGV